MSELRIMQNTYGTRLTFTVKSEGSIVDLTNFNVYLRLKGLNSLDAKFENQCTVSTPATLGVAYYTWEEGDLDTPGMYEIEVSIESTDGSIWVTSPEKQRIQVLPVSTMP